MEAAGNVFRKDPAGITLQVSTSSSVPVYIPVTCNESLNFEEKTRKNRRYRDACHTDGIDEIEGLVSSLLSGPDDIAPHCVAGEVCGAMHV